MAPDRIGRVREMEEAMERVAAALEAYRAAEALLEAVRGDVERLQAYYAAEWRADFEADERGAFPAGMKRGVLSEDGLYDLLGEAELLLRGRDADD